MLVTPLVGLRAARPDAPRTPVAAGPVAMVLPLRSARYKQPVVSGPPIQEQTSSIPIPSLERMEVFEQRFDRHRLAGGRCTGCSLVIERFPG